jgi:6-phosphogluconolactonase
MPALLGTGEQGLRESVHMRFHSGMKIFRNFLCLAMLLVTLLPAALSAAAKPMPANSNQYLFYVGTYTEEKGSTSKGIYAYRYDANSGEITPLGLAAETTNPSWVVVSPNGKYLYAANEVPKYNGPNSGGLSAFSIDHATGKLTFLNEVATRGADPCYVSIDKTGKYVLVANYTGGSVAVFPIQSDGKLGAATAFVQHTGHGADKERQEAPHAHFIDLSPDNRFALANDLGLDEVKIYKFDSSKGTLTPNDPPFAKVADGSGPRHLAIRADGKFVYVLSEIKGTITVFSYDGGKMQSPLQTISTLPSGYSGLIEDAEIAIQGNFLYASNREDSNTIAVFAIDHDKGTLSLVDITPTQGKGPRHFAIDPSGKLLFAENGGSDSIVIFSIDAKTGKLTPTGKKLDVSKPVCLAFVKVD